MEKEDNHKVKYSTRCFCGHLWMTDKNGKERNENDVAKFFKQQKNIKWVKFQLEKGKEGNLHWQYMFRTKGRKQRYTYWWKHLDYQKGEWIDGAMKGGKWMEEYVEKERTKVKGPFEYELNSNNNLKMYEYRSDVRRDENEEYARLWKLKYDNIKRQIERYEKWKHLNNLN